MPEAATNDPITVMLWGITPERLQEWARAQDGAQIELRGSPAAPGVVEGPARIVKSVDQMADVRDGEILVCGSTSPAWAPIFSRITATVTDIGGVMSHAAIVCREYGLPAVVGTGRATAQIRTGQRIRVDGVGGHGHDPRRGRGGRVRGPTTRPSTTPVRSPSLRAADTPRFGGKSTSLGELIAAGIPVPPGLRAVDERLPGLPDGGRPRDAHRRGDRGRAPGGRGHDAGGGRRDPRRGLRDRGARGRAGGDRGARYAELGAAAGRGALERGRRGQRRGDVRRPAGDVPLGSRRRRRVRCGARLLGEHVQRAGDDATARAWRAAARPRWA